MTITLCLLTWSRYPLLEKSLPHNLANANFKINEIVHVDNGTGDEEYRLMEKLLIDLQGKYGFTLKCVRHDRNLGVAWGYATASVLASSSHQVVTGMDVLMPKNWLSDMVEAITPVGTAIVSMYTQPIEKVSERIRGEKYQINDLEVIPALPFGRRLWKRELTEKAGHLRTDFGLYGADDIELGERQLRVCKEQGWKSIAIVNRVAEHLGCEGSAPFNGKDDKAYWEMKAKEVADTRKLEVLERCRKENYPYFTPFA